MRAGYGKNLRNFVQKLRIEQILDFGDLPVFEEATTYPSIIRLRKARPKDQFSATNIQTLDFHAGMPEYIAENKFTILTGELQPEGWSLTDSSVQKLLAKIKSKGIPLGEYFKGQIFRGIVTGLNEAFVIDQTTRDRLIEEDPKSAEIIKPFLAGRDIKRYQQPVSDKYLILAQRNIDIERYPKVYQHLIIYKSKLEKKAGSGKWYELQASPGEISKFEEPKIMYPDISKDLNFILDINSHYCVNTVYNLGASSLGLLGFLNSKIFLFYFQTISNSIRGGYLRFFTDYMKNCPIPDGVENLESSVKKVLEAKKQNPTADTTSLEQEIDRLVYGLYGLTEEEIGIVEGSNK